MEYHWKEKADCIQNILVQLSKYDEIHLTFLQFGRSILQNFKKKFCISGLDWSTKCGEK